MILPICTIVSASRRASSRAENRRGTDLDVRTWLAFVLAICCSGSKILIFTAARRSPRGLENHS